MFVTNARHTSTQRIAASGIGTRQSVQRQPAKTLTDNRPATVFQRKLQATIDVGGRAKGQGNQPIQRAIAIGTRHLPRTLDVEQLKPHFSPTQIQEILKLNGERERIYMFQNDDHFKTYFTSAGGFPPLISNVTTADLQAGHQMANRLRFGTINGPATHQVPTHAPGMHTIPQQQLPPSGPSHGWATTQNGANQQYTMWANQLQPPAYPTEFHTFGDPDNPSVWTSQGTYNLGGRVMPTYDDDYLADISRSQSTYGGLNTETGFVRGHPMSLNQQQLSTDPNRPNDSFDNVGIVYTRETDGTQGGLSTFRYNAVERPAEQTGQPFNQVNISSNPHGATQMGAAPVDTIHFSSRQPDGSYYQMEFDNQSVDYRTQIGSGNKFHARLKTHLQSANFPHENVYKPGDDYLDANRHSYPGYMSPPPTPFLSPQLRDEDTNVQLAGRHLQNEIILHNGDAWIIASATYDATQNRTTCALEKAFTNAHTGAFK